MAVKRIQIEAWLRDNAITIVDEPALEKLSTHFAPTSASALRKHLKHLGVPMSATVEGVNQDNFESLGRTLSALQLEYESKTDRIARQRIRDLIITAKQHARWAVQKTKDESHRAEKTRMIEWMQVWLENPVVFTAWLHAQQRQTATEVEDPASIE